MKLLDLFCGAGGAAAGYARAGFEVIGVDIEDHAESFARGVPGGTFIQSDWEDALHMLGHEADAIHASPPCQAYTWGTRKGREDDFPMYIDVVRESMLAMEVPYVIENVVGAPLLEPTVLCGSMFGLEVNRHRLFESSVDLWPVPAHPRCSGRIARGEAFTVAGHGGDSTDFRIATWRRAMGIEWMTKKELTEAIPPAYTEWIGEHIVGYLGREAAFR